MSVDDNVSWEDQLTYVQAGSWIAGEGFRPGPMIKRPYLTIFQLAQQVCSFTTGYFSSIAKWSTYGKRDGLWAKCCSSAIGTP